MTHTLTFAASHKSITSFETVELPSFVVLTGRNGSGKTHLLTAITNGRVRSSLVNNYGDDVKLFDSTNIIPQDTGVFDPYQYHSRRSNWFGQIQSQRENILPVVQHQLINLGIPIGECSSITGIRTLTKERLEKILPDSSRAEEVAKQVRDLIKNFGNQIYLTLHNKIGDDDWRKASSILQQQNPELFFDAPQSTLFENKSFLWGEVDPFQQAFGRVFATYRDLIHANDRLEKYPPPDEPSRRYLSPAEFRGQYGPPPWEFVNEILDACRLDFRVDQPPLHETVAYEPKLRKISNEVLMRFQDLSSGEKVLMSFALCLYNSVDNRQTKNFPKLLLLDEVDAPLHPSMTASLINTIKNVLVRDKNVSVILTTHSPSTVALAPEEAIYAMSPAGPRLEKISRSSAVSILTAGVPTISMSFDGRRQVFVESRTDAFLYEVLYQKFKANIKTERSLVFIPVGNSDESGGEHNSGCAQVIRLVETLSASGNQTVFGLVDWDGNRKASERVHVLSPDIRDGLESLIFDPVILLSLIVRENKSFAIEKGLIGESDTYFSLTGWVEGQWQAAIDRLQNIFFPSLMGEKMKIEYLNGMCLNVSHQYLHFDDHALCDKIISHFGFLKPKNKRQGDLMRHAIETVLSDMSGFLPVDLLSTFRGLLE